MKKVRLLAMFVFALAACDNSARTEAKMDSLKEKLDTTLDKLGDSARAKGQRAVETIKDKIQVLDKKESPVKFDSTGN